MAEVTGKRQRRGEITQDNTEPPMKRIRESDKSNRRRNNIRSDDRRRSPSRDMPPKFRERSRSQGSRIKDERDSKTYRNLDRHEESRSMNRERSRSRDRHRQREGNVELEEESRHHNPTNKPKASPSRRRRSRSPTDGRFDARDTLNIRSTRLSSAPSHDAYQDLNKSATKKELVGEKAGTVNEQNHIKQLMGFSSFRSTKNTKVPGNNIGAMRKDKQMKARQYMNRVGGFNRPLSPSR